MTALDQLRAAGLTGCTHPHSVECAAPFDPRCPKLAALSVHSATHSGYMLHCLEPECKKFYEKETDMTETTENYRIDHYYSINYGDVEHGYEEGHIFCTVPEGQEIEAALRLALPDAIITVEPGGEYDYTTESSTAAVIAADIVTSSGFGPSEEGDDEA